MNRPSTKAPGIWSRRASSLFSVGEPMIWMSGAALSVSLAMIVGLLLLVFVRGMATFWPVPVVRLETLAGDSVMGEVREEEEYRPQDDAFRVVPEDQREAARARVAAHGGKSTRRLIRTGNFDLTGSHFRWVSDFEVTSESRPEWAVVVERLEWGRFYGTPEAFTIDGKEVASGPEAVWKKYGEYHDAARDRWKKAQSIAKDDIGALNYRRKQAHERMLEAELDHGQESAEFREAEAAYQEVEKGTHAESEKLQQRIQELRAENDRYKIVFAHTTPEKPPKAISLQQIVRAYPANGLSVFGRIGVYLSRWWEFLWDEPREANTEGGVYPAIFGTVIMTLIMTLLVVPFGVLAALYLREYAKQGFLVSLVRIAVNNLAGVPSIVFGVFGLGFFCYIVGGGIDSLFFNASKVLDHNPTFGKSGLLWASLTLALLTLPVVIVATEEALAAVPRSMREGSYACGASKWQTIRRIVLPRATPGIMTGMILAIARGAGEVAPLMLVGAVQLAPELPLDGNAPFLHPQRSFMHLGFHIYDLGFQSPNSEAAKPMVFSTTLLLIGIVVVLNVVAIWVRARLRRAYHA